MNPSAADTELLTLARRGDQAALQQLLARSHCDLQRFSRRVCANAQDAEDATQVALWQLHQKIGTLQILAAFAGWLFRIVERECRRLLRLSQRAVPIDESTLAAAIEPAAPLDLRSDLVAAIAALPPIYREILVLRDIEEQTAPEAALHLGISVQAAKSRLHRARMLLREAFGGSTAARE